MTKTAAPETYTTKLAAAEADKEGRTVSGDKPVLKDAANEALRLYDPQRHAESPFPVLSPQNPGLVKG